MEWWQRMVVPLKRALVAMASRVRARKLDGGAGGGVGGAGGGILVKLCDEVQTCGYEDVQVMWEMLQRSGMELARPSTKKKHRRS